MSGPGLTLHFGLQEMLDTSTGLPNVPGRDHVENLRCLCAAVLEPWRELVGPLAVTSGFRAPAVNARVGGSATSQHTRGEAADVKPVRAALADAWRLLIGAAPPLPVDQAIVYVRERGRGWIHVSHTNRYAPRRDLLVQLGDDYIPWPEWDDRPLVEG